MNYTCEMVAHICFVTVNAPVSDGASPIEIAAQMVQELADIFEDTTLGQALHRALIETKFKREGTCYRAGQSDDGVTTVELETIA